MLSEEHEDIERLAVLKGIRQKLNAQHQRVIAPSLETINTIYWSGRAITPKEAIADAYWRGREDELSREVQ